MGFVAIFATKFTGMKAIDRIILFTDHLIEIRKIRSIAEFERVCDFYYGFIANQKRGKGAFDGESLYKIYEAYPELNMDWVVTGRGTMFYSESTSHYKEAYELATKQVEVLNRIIAENK